MIDYPNLTGEESQKLFDDLGQAYFGKPLWLSSFARMVNLQPRTVAKWMEQGNQPPQWAIMLLEAKTEAKAAKETLSQLGAALKVAIQLDAG